MLVSWNVTKECHLKCRHCYHDAGLRSGDELNTEEGKKLLKDIYQAGFRMIVFSGGEPLLRPDIIELTAFAAKVGLRPVFGSSGTVITLELAKELKKAGAMAIAISIDSIFPGKHDAFRGVPGAYIQAISGIEACKEAGLPFQINTTVMEMNINEIEELTELSMRLGAIGHHVLFLVPTGRGLEMGTDGLDDKKCEELLKKILDRQAIPGFYLKPTCLPSYMRMLTQSDRQDPRSGRGCLAGISYCSIASNGDVLPCPYLPLALDNIRKNSFDKIWQENSTLIKLREMVYSGKCGICEYKNICGGCRARAWYAENDLYGSEPWCSWQPENKPECGVSLDGRS